MTITMGASIVVPHPAFCPPPLIIQKKPRRATFHRRILRKSTHSQNSTPYVFGPLDDIINEIKSDIWESPPDYSLESSVFDWSNPLKAPSTWTVTPLPVSRIPSDQPLTIRKNRNSRSSTSGSSIGDAMANSRNNSEEKPPNGGPVGLPSNNTRPWPLLDTATSYERGTVQNLQDSNSCTDHLNAKQTLQDTIKNPKSRSEIPQRRPSRLRLFTSGFPRLRRMGTGDTSGSTGDNSETHSPTTASSLATYDEAEDDLDGKEPSEEVVEAHFRKIARNGTKFGSIMGRIARQLPSPNRDQHESMDGNTPETTSTMPTILRAAVRIFPETKILTADCQEFSVAVDVEGVLHNRKRLPDATVDVIFVVDNGYYVTKGCLEKALDAINGALYHLDRGDRLALYTTHCAHHEVTGNRPDLHYPLRPFSTDSEETFRELTTSIAINGTQVWDPPRPNPCMTDVILGIARSLEGQELKTGRTHIILLSPAAYVLHGISSYFPDLYIHRMNPAALPYRRNPELQDTICTDACCKNVFVTNWSSYQSVSGRIKRILKNARSEKPVGDLTDLSIEIRTRSGCEVITYCGSKDVPTLRVGQIHTYGIRLRVTRSNTQGVELESGNPIFRSSLDVKGLRQELLNAVTVGAIKVHLLDVQVLYRNSLHTADCWNYTETPLLTIRELGGLAPPQDAAVEVYKRRYFCNIASLTPDAAKIKAEECLLAMTNENDAARKIIQRMAKEIERHQEIQAYEDKFRQKLPMCPGPIEIESSAHEWLVDIWNRKKSKRKGVAVVKEQDITGLLKNINGLE